MNNTEQEVALIKAAADYNNPDREVAQFSLMDFYEESGKDGLRDLAALGIYLMPVTGGKNPVREVEVGNFRAGVFAVTQGQFNQIMGRNPSHFQQVEGVDSSMLPVENVNWNDAVEFCQTLSEMTGLKIRLPTEEEWEYAARGGTSTHYWWGDDITPEQANYVNSRHRRPVEVYRHDPNPYGLYNTHGNVWEWTGSGENESPFRVFRGGCWDGYGPDCRSAVRYGGSPGLRSDFVGFRVAVDDDSQPDLTQREEPSPPQESEQKTLRFKYKSLRRYYW